MRKTRTRAEVLSMEEFHDVADFHGRWNEVDVLTLPAASNRKYIVGFASSDRSVEQTLRMRYEVFNIELGEGLAESSLTGLDRDAYDDQMTHLVLLDRREGRIVGTYRMQTVQHALVHAGIYTAQEFDLATLRHLFPSTLEVGRACLVEGHRSFAAIMAIWLGMGAYMRIHEQRYLIGCCSIASEDPDDGWRALKTLRKKGNLHPDLFVPATFPYSCGAASREFDEDLGDAIPLPKLFGTYMKLGTMIASEPAIDRDFGTVDFLALMDAHSVTLSHLDIRK